MFFQIIGALQVVSGLFSLVSGGSCDYYYWYGILPIAKDVCNEVNIISGDYEYFMFTCDGTTGSVTNYTSSGCGTADVTEEISFWSYLCDGNDDSCDTIYISGEDYENDDCSGSGEGENYIGVVSNVNCTGVTTFFGTTQYTTFEADYDSLTITEYSDSDCSTVSDTSESEAGCEKTNDTSSYTALGTSFTTLSGSFGNNGHLVLYNIVALTFAAIMAQLMV